MGQEEHRQEHGQTPEHRSQFSGARRRRGVIAI
jgi:hypothetical protein